jgi:predicted transcriptional regulator
MATVRRILELDPETEARLVSLAAEKGQDEATIVSDAIALLDSVIDVAGPDIDEDRRRFAEFERSGEAVLLADVKAWVESWDTVDELPQPVAKKIR